MIAKRDGVTLAKAKAAYTPVVQELLNKPKQRPYSCPILIEPDENADPYSCLLNPKYVAPKEGLKGWGCLRNQKPPKGHYDVNFLKLNRTFALDFTPWRQLIDAPVITRFSAEETVAELLWEITYYGWSESEVEAIFTGLTPDPKKATPKVKAGKAKEIPPKKKGRSKIAKPVSVRNQKKDPTSSKQSR